MIYLLIEREANGLVLNFGRRIYMQMIDRYSHD
jgi:hypothetical protein